MINIRTIVIVAGIIFFAACNGSKTLDRAGLIAYVNDAANGLSKEMESGNSRYKITYRPSDLLIDQELRSGTEQSPDSLRNFYSDCFYFVLSLQRDSMEVFGRLTNDYSDLLKKISFSLRDYVSMTDNRTGETYYLNDFIYPRMYNSTAATSVLLCFKDPGLKSIGDFTITIKDFLNEDQSTGTIKLNFLINDVKNTPTLKITDV